MAKAKRTVQASHLDPMALQILNNLLADFVHRGVTAADLQDGYEGLALPTIIQKCSESDSFSQVDFDLALKQLEDSDLVKTGPMEPYENEPGSELVIFGLFSKREYVLLTEEGYRLAKKPRPAFERF